MTKRFEPEVGRSLVKLGVYHDKVPDSKFNNFPGRPDYLTISVDGSGWLCELEAKETTTEDRFPFLGPGSFTPNQVRALTDVNTQGGLGLGLVNFGRRPTRREAGLVGVYRWPFMTLAEAERRGRDVAWHRVHGLSADLIIDPRLRKGAPPSLFLEDADLILQRDVGTTWPLEKVLTRAFWAER